MANHEADSLKELKALLEKASHRTSYAIGVEDGLNRALALVQNDEDTQRQPELMQVSYSDNEPQRNRIQEPVIEALKQSGPMTITEIIIWARERGFDLQRPAVGNVLKRLKGRGLVTNIGQEFRIESVQSK